MKAILLAHDFPPGLGGGISAYCYNLCRELGGAISVLAPASRDGKEFDSAQPFTIHRRGIPISSAKLMKEDRFPMLRWPLAGFLAATQWVQFYRHGGRLLKAENADVALIGHLYLAPLGVPLRRSTGARYGVVLYGSELHRYMHIAPVKHAMLGALNAADFIIVISEFARGQYLARGVRSDQRFFKLNPGVDTSRFSPESGDPDQVRRRHQVGGRPVVMSVARLVAWKGQDTMIRSMPRVLDRISDAVYLIVGDGPHRAALESLVRELRLEKNVIFAGYVPESELPSYYRAANVMVVATREAAKNMPLEGFGIVYLEAGACGTPVIGGRGGGTDESIEEGVTGLLVDPLDGEELADAVIELLSNRELAERLGRAGRTRAVQSFDWALQGQRLRAFLESVVAGEQG